MAEKIVGAYEQDGKIVVFHNSGKMESYYDGKKEGGEYKWKIVDKEVHAVTKDGGGSAWGINPDGSLIYLAVIQSNGNRLYLPRLPKIGNTDYQPYWKKITNYEEHIRQARQTALYKSIGITETVIRETLKKPEGEITEADLRKITGLNLANKHIFNASALKIFPQLKKLDLSANQLTDVKGLEKLTQLRELTLFRNKLTDVKGLEKLTLLTELRLSDNQLTNVQGLENLTQLTKLILVNNQLTDVTGLEKLTQLTHLYLNDNPALTKAKIAELKKALPRCKIWSNAK